MEFEKFIGKATDVIKKPARLALVSAVATVGAYACGDGYPSKGEVVGKWHEDEQTWAGSVQETRQQCDPIPVGVPIGGGLHCRAEFYDVDATIVDDEDWVVSVNSCKDEEQKDCHDVWFYTDQQTYDSVSEGQSVDFSNGKNISREDPTYFVKN